MICYLESYLRRILSSNSQQQPIREGVVCGNRPTREACTYWQLNSSSLLLNTQTYDMLYGIVFKTSFDIEFSTATHKRGCCVWEERNERRAYLRVVRSLPVFYSTPKLMICCLKPYLRRLLASNSQQQPIREGVVCGKREKSEGCI